MFYDRFLSLCREKGFSPSAAATSAGFNKGTVSVWKRKYKEGTDVVPEQDVINKICNFFGCSESWLRGIDEEHKIKTPTREGGRNISDLDVGSTVTSDTPNLQPLANSISNGIRIPVLGSVPAGTPIEAIQDIIDWEELPSSMLTGGKEYFALQVSGDSMYPDYLTGDIVIVQKQNTCNSGDDCVVYVNGYDATLKTVKFRTDGSMTLQPVNPSYPPRTFTPEEIRDLPVSIAGVVVELRRKCRNRKI